MESFISTDEDADSHLWYVILSFVFNPRDLYYLGSIKNI